MVTVNIPLFCFLLVIGSSADAGNECTDERICSQSLVQTAEYPRRMKLAEDSDNMERFKTLASHASDDDQEAAMVLNLLIDAEKEGKSAAEIDALLLPYYDVIFRIIEEESARIEANVASRDGELVSSEMLQELHGLTKSPEQAAQSDAAGCVLEGDMKSFGSCEHENTSLLQAAVVAGRRWAGELWKGPIKYCFAANTAASSKKAIKDAFAHITAHVPCITFTEVLAEVRDGNMPACVGADKAMYVTSTGQMCSANIGAPNFKQFPGVYVTEVNLAPHSCDVLGIAVHEVGHALGMLHEQARTDYSKYVKINWDNIEESGKSQYATNTNADRTVPYDLQSVMHYPETMFGKYNDQGTQLRVMTKTNDALNKGKVMGNRMGLTRADAIQLGKMYGCESKVPNFELCSSDGGCSSNPKCKCHQDPKEGSGKVIKINPQKDCFRCVTRCPNSIGGLFDGSPDCGGCPSGCAVKTTVSDGTPYKSCIKDGTATCPVAE
eukprot:TRINITY_DN50103_c0_g1_i1.p1 TRINITY_DN50103_c0_g1~~TRINITY_DN50103_c0_g1_i1.p1  ORF type:complete len:513 (-),score=83.34 TRINITY_DN50103_c0_g1_i1:77-1561(-)